MDELREEVRLTLEQSRRTLDVSTNTIRSVADIMEETRPLIIAALDRLNANLQTSEAIMADISPRIGPLYDSLTATISDTRQLMAKVLAIADTAQSVLNESAEPISISLGHLQRAAQVLENFANQVSRRPTRLLTGVTPPDTTGGDR